MDTRVTKVTGKAKGENHGRTYTRNTRPTHKVLYKNKIFQGLNGRSASVIIQLRGKK